MIDVSLIDLWMWWTITGNFGNILPIDWSKSYARKLHMPALNLNENKYLTTVIPYHLDSGPLDNQALQVLIKILKAINDDSPTVPTLLTDYILKGEYLT
ncbi:hypothetical protein LSTR_LSTR007764 [Laodelphax striatellus]|uniref:Uncharacterized protein n=1 Tax=Laodelphax striatellus TaxID=195883 RepID=A0A482XRP3_LAOST|nr:hypothetical protein LSTR_LSTR007764 [Laodelphax striatellus]